MDITVYFGLKAFLKTFWESFIFQRRFQSRSLFIFYAGKEGVQMTTGRKTEEKKKVTRNEGLNNMHYRDSSGKMIFEDPILCSQFLRDYVDIPMLKDVQPEDIEDVTERYVHMFIEERNSDVVKKVNLKENSFYVISLIEHKSDVDYNVVMQVFRYITFIWEDYEKEQEMKYPNISKTKDFKYPPVLPILFYDGIDNWTAATSLHERVFFSDILGKYIPDYQCILIQLKEYSNEELMKKKDELSLLLMVDKLKDIEDYEKFAKELDEAFLEEMTGESPEYLLKMMAQVIRMFLAKLNVPREEADIFTEQIKERKMGELFKHFQGWDVQALRQEIKEAKEEAEKVREKVREEVREEGINKFLKVVKKYHGTKEEATTELMEEYELIREIAEEKVALYW